MKCGLCGKYIAITVAPYQRIHKDKTIHRDHTGRDKRVREGGLYSIGRSQETGNYSEIYSDLSPEQVRDAYEGRG